MRSASTRGEHVLARAAAVAADAIYCTDVSGRITAWNLGAERLYGLSSDIAMGLAASALDADSSGADIAQARTEALQGRRVERFDTVQRRAGGSEVPVSLTIAPLEDDEGVVGTAHMAADVSLRVELAARLQEAQDVLEQQNALLVRSNRDLEQFAYVASHDLSEPLRVISGFVTHLEQQYADAFDERGARYLRHIVEGAARMRALVDDLLEYSRFLRAGRQLADVALDDVVSAALSRLATAIEESGAEVEVGPLPTVLGDRSQLQSLMQNLLANALKFTSPGLAPRVRVTGHVDGDVGVVLVDDGGIGIEEPFRERVFSMFQRLHVREDYSGTGIGLAIVRQVAELHGGTVRVEDSPLGGARFRVVLPVRNGGRHGVGR